MDAYDISTGVSIQIQFNKALTEKMPLIHVECI